MIEEEIDRENIFRIVTWNCRGRFSEKFEIIKELDADVYIIQECKNPKYEKPRKKKQKDYCDFVNKSDCWVGDTSSSGRGVGIFVNKNYTLCNNEWNEGVPGYYVSGKICRKNIEFNILGVWAKGGPNYEKGVYSYLKEQKINGKLTSDYIIAGDMNLDMIIGNEQLTCEIIEFLNKDMELFSTYHEFPTPIVIHGKEKEKTYYDEEIIDLSVIKIDEKILFPSFKISKPKSHVDYVFANKNRKLEKVYLGKPEIWLKHSDHLPLIVDLIIE